MAEEEAAIDQSSDEDTELEKLEEEVKLMALKLSEFRETLPDQLQNTLALILSAQRPVLLDLSGNGAASSSSNPNPVYKGDIHKTMIESIPWFYF